MTEHKPTDFSEFSFYVAQQIERIFATLQDHNNALGCMEQINNKIDKQSNKFHELESKMKLLEVYQSENFKNNERLFNSQVNLDVF